MWGTRETKKNTAWSEEVGTGMTCRPLGTPLQTTGGRETRSHDHSHASHHITSPSYASQTFEKHTVRRKKHSRVKRESNRSSNSIRLRPQCFLSELQLSLQNSAAAELTAINQCLGTTHNRRKKRRHRTDPMNKPILFLTGADGIICNFYWYLYKKLLTTNCSSVISLTFS